VVCRRRVESGEPEPDCPGDGEEEVKVSTEGVQPGAAEVPSPQPVPELENDNQGPSVPFDASLSCEALAFCRLHGIESELRLAIGTVRRCFRIIGNPDVELVHDRETEDAAYLIIEIQVRGEVKDIVMAHRKFASETARSLGPKRAIIALNYYII
jgi:hypothetical protein